MQYRIILLLVTTLTMFSSQALAQAGKYYKTYAEYENGGGTAFDEYESYQVSNSVATAYTFKINGEKVKVKSKELWGFSVGDHFFRVSPHRKAPALLWNDGNVYFYINGSVLLGGGVPVGLPWYMSEALETEMAPYYTTGNAMDKGPLGDLWKKNPEYKPLYECIKSLRMKQGRELINCVEEFQGKSLH